jgi:hypothetical protein
MGDTAVEVAGLRKRFGPTLAPDGMTFTAEPGQGCMELTRDAAEYRAEPARGAA